METRPLGSLQVSTTGLGCNNFGWKIDAAGTAAVVDAALEAGINFFDTADMYGGTKSEEYLGQALGARRDQVLIATKFGMRLDDARPGGAKPAYIRQAAEDSLRRLGTDRIDLYQIHKPDPDTPIAETMAALNELVQAGKVREIGCSNFSVAQLREAEAAVPTGGARFVSVQNEYSMLKRGPEEDGVLAECERAGVALLPFFPLASGLLSGKYRKGQPPPAGSRIADTERFQALLEGGKLDLVERLIAFAEGRGHTLLELAFSWLLSRSPVASVIAGATRPDQVRANARAGSWRLSPEELQEVDTILSAA